MFSGMSTDGGSDGTRDPRPADTITNIVDQVTSACAASQCPDAAVMTNLYNETMLNNFDTYLQSGELQTKIRIWAAERVPPVPDLFEVQILGTTFNTDGTFVNMLDDPNATVEALSITTSGKLSVTCLNTTHSPLPKKIRRRPALKVLSSLHSSKLGLALTLPPMQLQQMPPLPTLLKMHLVISEARLGELRLWTTDSAVAVVTSPGQLSTGITGLTATQKLTFQIVLRVLFLRLS